MKKVSLRAAVAYYLESRRKLGFALVKIGVQLNGLVRYAQETHHRGPLTTRLALELESKRGWQPDVYRALFGLLACTGLRISEALALEDQDVDCKSGLLTVRRGKGGHSRSIPLDASAVAALDRYRQLRRRTVVQPKCAAFFLSSVGKPLVYTRVAAVFRQLCNGLGWTHPPRPRLHDLRHTFAVRCLIEWHEKNEDVGQKILALSTYLGHRQVTDTYWYLTAVPQLLKIVSKRFETGAKGDCI